MQDATRFYLEGLRKMSQEIPTPTTKATIIIA